MLAGIINEQTAIGILQLIVGKYIKQNPSISNKVIPVFTFAAAVLGFSLMPASASAASALGDLGVGAGSIFALALAQNIAITGVHSTAKNTVLPALKFALLFLARKVGGVDAPPAD